MRAVLISDTHTKHKYSKVPDGDILIHAGDMTNVGSMEDLEEFIDWFGSFPHEHKIFIAGNHDWCFVKKQYGEHDFDSWGKKVPIHYLQDSSTTVAGLKVYGSPWQPFFYNWAFNLPRGQALIDKWAMIPEDTDILITHGPPRGINDYIPHDDKHEGCDDLLERVKVVKPKLHVFGHLHDGYGITTTDDTVFVNAAALDDRYRPVHIPIVMDLIDGKFVQGFNKS